jgi:hypothetical protein
LKTGVASEGPSVVRVGFRNATSNRTGEAQEMHQSASPEG